MNTDARDSLMATLAELRGAAMAYRNAVNLSLDTETSNRSRLPRRYQNDPTLALSELQAAENRLVQAVRVADHILRPMPPAALPPIVGVLPDGTWRAMVSVSLTERYEIELEANNYEAETEAAAVDRIKWDAMGMTPEQIREEYRKPNPNNVKLDTFVDVTAVGTPEFEPDGESGA